ncbi:uncharacterized protein SPSK_04738 [Sporothrix schenckii 1099-18]|uniref:Uncharacterized protein n=1 Tax=Sporothrix schenckii 1099-18 TaxID=1397361 RepID=A0A0F2M136_SPOSC|nr:uncharacterized protein SPSK_04738 [Sporothrix schenckii 1099-18]KJR83422.1 hypothetical protein SPSK_04738 [Sporothrix schenckii 1099-18]
MASISRKGLLPTERQDIPAQGRIQAAAHPAKQANEKQEHKTARDTSTSTDAVAARVNGVVELNDTKYESEDRQ